MRQGKALGVVRGAKTALKKRSALYLRTELVCIWKAVNSLQVHMQYHPFATVHG
jgi:hypothetical protein